MILFTQCLGQNRVFFCFSKRWGLKRQYLFLYTLNFIIIISDIKHPPLGIGLLCIPSCCRPINWPATAFSFSPIKNVFQLITSLQSRTRWHAVLTRSSRTASPAKRLAVTPTLSAQRSATRGASAKTVSWKRLAARAWNWKTVPKVGPKSTSSEHKSYHCRKL